MKNCRLNGLSRFTRRQLSAVLMVITVMGGVMTAEAASGWKPNAVEGAMAFRTASVGERFDWEISTGAEWRSRFELRASADNDPADNSPADNCRRYLRQTKISVLTERESGRSEWGYDVEGKLARAKDSRLSGLNGLQKEIRYASIKRTAQDIDRQMGIWIIGRSGIYGGVGLAGHEFQDLNPVFVAVAETGKITATVLTNFAGVNIVFGEANFAFPVKNNVDLTLKAGGIWDQPNASWRVKAGVKVWL